VKLLIAGGGTGGHVFPAIAIAREWLSRGSEREVVLVGTQRGIEMKLVPPSRAAARNSARSRTQRQGRRHTREKSCHALSGMADAFSIVRKHKPVAAFGVGGYAAGPMLLATWLRGIPNVIFEPNAEPGSPTKFSRVCHAVSPTGYPITAEKFGKKAVLTGNPVRAEFLLNCASQNRKSRFAF